MKRLLLWLLLPPVLVLIYVWAGIGTEFSFSELFGKGYRIFDQIGRMWPPDWNFLNQLWKPLQDTLRMAILGTTLGAVISLPLIVLSTRSVTREAWIYYPTRLVMGVIRSIPDLLYAILFVAIFGIGPIAGIPVLMIFSAAIIAKMTSESADNIDRGPIEALEATGAGRLSVIFFAVIPQIFPFFLSYALYVLELNIRVAAILGFVGAGGIGVSLKIALEFLFSYPAIMTISIVIFVIVFVIDYVSGRFRQSLVSGRELQWWWKAGFGLVLLVGIVWAAASLQINPERIQQGLVNFGRIGRSLLSPDWSVLGMGVDKMVESIQIALIGTTISMFFAFPFGFLCANNLGLPNWLVFAFRQVPNIIRTFPELILAIFFIGAFGPGPFPGVLALAVHSIGMLSRMNYEIVENIDRGPSEALSALGAGRMLGFRFAVLPQVIPEFIAMGLYRFEINIRAASVLGIVGAGGIGTLIYNASTGSRDYPALGTFLVIIIVFVGLIDLSSSWIRKKLIEG